MSPNGSKRNEWAANDGTVSGRKRPNCQPVQQTNKQHKSRELPPEVRWIKWRPSAGGRLLLYEASISATTFRGCTTSKAAAISFSFCSRGGGAACCSVFFSFCWHVATRPHPPATPTRYEYLWSRWTRRVRQPFSPRNHFLSFFSAGENAPPAQVSRRNIQLKVNHLNEWNLNI